LACHFGRQLTALAEETWQRGGSQAAYHAVSLEFIRFFAPALVGTALDK
jgi:hypothetical protein